MNTKKVAEIIIELSLQIECMPFEIVDSLVGSVINEEDSSEIKEIILERYL